MGRWMVKNYLCFDVGGTNVKYGVLSATGDWILRSRYPTRKATIEQFIHDIQEVIQTVSAAHVIEKVAISFPGFIDPISGYAKFAGAIEVLHGKNIKNMIEAGIDIPVVVENDANCALLAEKLKGNATKCHDFICMTIGTGIGGGLFVNGKLVRGHAFQAGEFGLMVMNGLDQGYQNFHQLASTSALIEQYKKLTGKTQDELIEGEEVFSTAATNPEVQKLIQKWYQYISIGIFNLVATLNPEKVLIGGAISVRGDLYNGIYNQLKQIHSWKDIEVPVESCRFHNDAGLLGALYLALNEDYT